MKLSDTVGMMINRTDYKERFKAEYYQTMIRFNSLYIMIDKFHYDALEFDPETPVQILILQLKAMDCYLRILEKRAEIEGIKLEGERYRL